MVVLCWQLILPFHGSDFRITFNCLLGKLTVRYDLPCNIIFLMNEKVEYIKVFIVAK
jgi:hypothetical protein